MNLHDDNMLIIDTGDINGNTPVNKYVVVRCRRITMGNPLITLDLGIPGKSGRKCLSLYVGHNILKD